MGSKRWPQSRRPAAPRRSTEYPHLLRGLRIDRPNQVWVADLTYILMAPGFLDLVVVMDWYSRCVLPWRLSNMMDTSFCLDALEDTLRKGQPELFNTDQGAQFTSMAFTDRLETTGVRISMDGRRRWPDNVLRRTAGVQLEVRRGPPEGLCQWRRGVHRIGQWPRFYDERRPHQALGYKTPAAAGPAEVSPADLLLRLDDTGASPKTPQCQQQQNVIHI